MMTIPDLSDKHILVVEDDDMGFLYLNQLLMLTRCTITRAYNGVEAESLFRDGQFELVLMDIQLPDITGLIVTATIRKTDPRIPIIAQTAHKTTEEADNALAAGCNAVLVKPIMMDKLYETLLTYM
jgi:CheY-like chemotaxis protein